jgi:hypothetical protein
MDGPRINKRRLPVMFRDSSLHLTASLTKEEKKSQGIFFTPKDARDAVFAILAKHKVVPRKILEPSCGSGEFLEDAYERYPSATITGVELNPQLAASIQRPNIHAMDFLTYSGQHDLILGNPPYVVIPKSAETAKCQTNRPNLFVQFLYKAIHENLTRNGVLAFVLPTSLFNCAYYEPMRRYLLETTTILAAEFLGGDYLDTDQKTFALVLRKKKGRGSYLVRIQDNVYLTPYYRKLRALLKGTSTLAGLGYEVKTGEVVWNQVKEKLADEGTLLIYSGNFSKGVLEFGPLKGEKKQYIQGFGRAPLSGKTILINRGYGNTAYTLNVVIADYPEYYAENHVNVIRPQTPEAAARIDAVYASLRDERTALFIQYFVGNGALSKSEIETCLPIWTD